MEQDVIPDLFQLCPEADSPPLPCILLSALICVRGFVAESPVFPCYLWALTGSVLLCRLVRCGAAAEVTGDRKNVCQHGVQVLQLQCPPAVSAHLPGVQGGILVGWGCTLQLGAGSSQVFCTCCGWKLQLHAL